MFNSKYPIIALGMNRVSDLQLALAVANAGAIPTISGFNYIDSNNLIDLFRLENDIKIYKEKRNNCNFIFSIDDCIIQKNFFSLLDFFLKYKIHYLEIIIDPKNFENNYSELIKIFILLKNNNITLLTKILSFDNITNQKINLINYIFDGIIIKGNNGAGRVSHNSKDNLENLFKLSKKLFVDKFIIASGGIESSVDVKKYLDLGAGAVGIGTLFAASSESSLSKEAKEKIVKAKSSDLQKLETYDLNQNALIFTVIDQSKINNTAGLIKGIRSGTTGHIFLGKSIDSIKEIKSVHEIILDLTNF